MPTNSQYGNRISATRWAKILTQLGCQARITSPDDLYHRETDLLVALHARHSAGSIASFRRKYPERPIVLILTGTDLYRDIRSNKSAQRSLELADQLVVLQERGLDEVPRRMHDKSCVIYQSETHRPRTQPALHRNFRVIVIGHLR
ncbi:MAG: TIGR04348 family glycosyltransferase, partial [Phycisphaerae bacterium]